MREPRLLPADAGTARLVGGHRVEIELGTLRGHTQDHASCVVALLEIAGDTVLPLRVRRRDDLLHLTVGGTNDDFLGWSNPSTVWSSDVYRGKLPTQWYILVQCIVLGLFFGLGGRTLRQILAQSGIT
jgi:hypothetical protein